MSIRKRGRRKKTLLASLCPLAALGLAVAVCVVAGCLPSPSKPTTQAPPFVAEGPTPEQAYWRNRYEQNRPVPPEQYQVMPKPPRNNQFGEFDEALYQGLDRQPALPSLPADSYAAGRAAGYPLPPSDLSAMAGSDFAASQASYSGPAATARPGPAAASAAMPSRPAGINANGHFYPMEQLVYGGDYPDIDKPELYRLMPKDVVTVTVKDHPEFSAQIEIQPDGTVRVPNAHDLVRLRGLTVDEAAEAVRQTLQVYVRGECVVRVQANRARGGYYFVFGDVLQPGRFPMGLEPVKLSEAVLAANWEANPSRMDADGDELGPSFPAASPRGRYIAPRSADMARVMLVTPHRSQPVRTVHDVRSAMLGVTANDPVIRPGQIIVVPSLVEARNRSLGIDAAAPGVPAPPEGKMPGQGFSGPGSSARLPDVTPEPVVRVPSADSWSVSVVEANMIGAFDSNMNESGARFQPEKTIYVDATQPSGRSSSKRGQRGEPPIAGDGRAASGWNKGF